MVSKLGKNKIIWICLVISCILIGVKLIIVTDISMIDECHQIATSYRFYLGDAPLVDDWSLLQLHCLILLPLVSFFTGITRSTAGIVLFIRVFYFVLRLAVAIWALRKARNHSKGIYPVAAVFIWYCFIPFNIETMTYQALPLLLMFVAVVNIVCGKLNRLSCVVLGIVYSLAILTQPFWIISFIPIMIWMFANRKRYLSFIMYYILGIMIIFFVFCMLVFSRTGIHELLINLPCILSDSDHSVGIVGLISQVIYTFLSLALDYKYVTLINLIFIGALIILSLRKSSHREKMRALMPVCLLVSVILIIVNRGLFVMNEMFIPFFWMGIENLFFEYRNKKYIYLFLMSLLFTIATAMGTNTGILATSASLNLMAVVVLLFIKEECPEENTCKRMQIQVPAVLVCIMTLGIHVYVTWWGEHISLSGVSHMIQDGPMKYMCAEESNYREYYEIYNAVRDMGIGKDDILFVGTRTPLAYLDAETEFGTMATPFFELDYDRLRDYYDLHEDKRPTVVYFYNAPDEDIDSTFFSKYFTDMNTKRIGNSVIIKDGHE